MCRSVHECLDVYRPSKEPLSTRILDRWPRATLCAFWTVLLLFSFSPRIVLEPFLSFPLLKISVNVLSHTLTNIWELFKKRWGANHKLFILTIIRVSFFSSLLLVVSPDLVSVFPWPHSFSSCSATCWGRQKLSLWMPPVAEFCTPPSRNLPGFSSFCKLIFCLFCPSYPHFSQNIPFFVVNFGIIRQSWPSQLSTFSMTFSMA